jgi:hypothetical protein
MPGSFRVRGLELLNEFFAGYNVVGLPIGNTNTQMAGWFRREIRGIEDFSGLKMRIGGLAGQVIAKLGAVPQQIAAGDVHPALEKGTIDAAEWVGPYDDEKLGFHKIAPYYYSGWWEGASAIFLLVNKAKWEELSPEDQALMAAAAHQANTLTIARYDQLNPRAIRRLAPANPATEPSVLLPEGAARRLRLDHPGTLQQSPHGGVESPSLGAARTDRPTLADKLTRIAASLPGPFVARARGWERRRACGRHTGCHPQEVWEHIPASAR